MKQYGHRFQGKFENVNLLNLTSSSNLTKVRPNFSPLKPSDKNALIPFAAYNQAGEVSSKVHRCKRKWGAEIPQSLETATGKGVQALEVTLVEKGKDKGFVYM